MIKSKNFLEGERPPTAIDIEESVLGAMMIDKEGLHTGMRLLNEAIFYKGSHIIIFNTIKAIYKKGNHVDIMTITQQLKEQGKLEDIGGPVFITQLTDMIGSTAHMERYCYILMEQYLRRKMIDFGHGLISSGHDESNDTLELYDNSQRDLNSLGNIFNNKSFSSIDKILTNVIDNIEKNRVDKLDVTGIPSGFNELDKITAGWQNSDLIIVAARPGMGKTGFMLSLARNAALQGSGIGIFSLEMSNEQLVERLLSAEADINNRQLKLGRLNDREWQNLKEHTSKLAKANIIIDDCCSLNILQLQNRARQMKIEMGVDLFMVDYLQLMSGISDGNKTRNREQEISSISRGLKAIAKELNTPFIALSQLSRAVETRGGLKKPQLSDLRESGSLEQDSDLVLFLYRPEYYGIMESDGGTNLKGTAEVIIAKHRNGALDEIMLKFKKHTTSFSNPLNAEQEYELEAETFK